MEKYLNHFKALDYMEKLLEIKRISISIVNDQKKVNKILEKDTTVFFSSSSHSNARRNMSARSKLANETFTFKHLSEQKDLLKEYVKYL